MGVRSSQNRPSSLIDILHKAEPRWARDWFGPAVKAVSAVNSVYFAHSGGINSVCFAAVTLVVWHWQWHWLSVSFRTQRWCQLSWLSAEVSVSFLSVMWHNCSAERAPGRSDDGQSVATWLTSLLRFTAATESETPLVTNVETGLWKLNSFSVLKITSRLTDKATRCSRFSVVSKCNGVVVR